MLPAIDAHHHFWNPDHGDFPWMTGAYLPIRRVFTPDDLRPLLAPAGVQKTILVQTQANLAESREFLAIAEATGFVAGVVAWVDLTSPAVGSDIDALIAGPGGRWLVGIRHQVHDEPDADWLSRADVRRGLQAVAARDLVYDLLLRPREVPAALGCVRAMPDLRFVVDHIAKPDIAGNGFADWAALMQPFAEQPYVRCKLSGMVTEADWRAWTRFDIMPYIERALQIFGADRCMAGSDWPVCLLASDYGRTFNLVRDAIATLPLADQQAILWNTAATTYRLDEGRLG